MITTVGPLLWILVRLCVNPINTRRDISVRVFFNYKCDYDTNYDAFGNGYKLGGGSVPGGVGEGGRECGVKISDRRSEIKRSWE